MPGIGATHLDGYKMMIPRNTFITRKEIGPAGLGRISVGIMPGRGLQAGGAGKQWCRGRKEPGGSVTDALCAGSPRKKTVGDGGKSQLFVAQCVNWRGCSCAYRS